MKSIFFKVFTLLTVLFISFSCENEDSDTINLEDSNLTNKGYAPTYSEDLCIVDVNDIRLVRILILDKEGKQPDYKRLRLRAENTCSNKIYIPKDNGKDFSLAVGTYIFKQRYGKKVLWKTVDLNDLPIASDGRSRITLKFRD